jgi:lipopolysaccharide/colanic/teichoic acid biosynthesis glycosyltransferase
MRRLGDFVIACLILALTSPLMLVIALAIKSGSAGPVFDRKHCIGYGGRFQMLKFRTTVYDPDRAVPIWARRRRRLATSFDTPVSRTFRS